MERLSRAPAKLNLALHILGRRDDSYHALESLAAFAGVSDILRLAPGPSLTLRIEGPTAQAAGETTDNLVIRAANHLRARIEGLKIGAFHLIKTLPVAAGIGGGSSDAAAALRLLAQENDLALDDPRLYEAAQATGADVPVCLSPRARIMSGIGEVLGPQIPLPPLYAVLVNPRVAVETRAVFAKLGLRPGDGALGQALAPLPAPMPAPLQQNRRMPQEALFAYLRKSRNDLEAPASVIAPIITDVLAVLGAARGCRLARMSGSGATCFALFATRREALRAAAVIARGHPEWWIRAVPLK